MIGAEARALRATGLCVFGFFVSAALAAFGRAPTSVAASLGLVFVPYAFAWLYADALSPERAFRITRRAALVAGAALCLAPPVLSDDLFRYLWDGHVSLHGIDPYAHAPLDAALYDLRDRYFTRVNHPEIRTIYPPVAQLVFALVSALWRAPIALKFCFLMCHLATIAAVRDLAQGSPRAVVAFGLNPLALSESALNGHVDALLALALAYAFVGLKSERTIKASLWLAIATGTKLVGLLFLPLLARHKLRHAFLALGLCALVLSPMFWPRDVHDVSGVEHYARRWRGNVALYGVLEEGVSALLRSQARADERVRDHIRIERLATLVYWVEGTPFDPWRGALPDHNAIPDRVDFEIPFLAGLLTRIVVLALVSISTLLIARMKSDGLLIARNTLLFALLLSPQIHPWYLLWLIPFEAASGRLVAIAWSLSVLVAYAPLDLWQQARIWNETSLAKLCEFSLVILVFLFEFWVFNKQRSEKHARLSPVQDHPHAPGGGLSA